MAERKQYTESDSEPDCESASKFGRSHSTDYDRFDNEYLSRKRQKISETSENSENWDKIDSNSESDKEPEQCQTDKDGHIICQAGQKFGKYKFERIIGEGGFGRVLKVKSSVTGQNAAMKVVKNEPTKRNSAMQEIIALTTIACRDPNDKSLCLKMLEWFNHGGHICIVFPLLGASVFDFLKSNDFEPFSVGAIRHIGYQLCTAVGFIHRNGMKHTDVKPENIMLLNSSYTTAYDNQQKKAVRHPVCTDIRLIDFGNVTRDGDFHNPVVGTVYYQAPEVKLRLGWTHSCDTWAVGCTLFEIYYGNLLFPSEDDQEHLAMMEKILGEIPSTMVESTKKRQFFKDGIINWNWDEADEETKNCCIPLNNFIKCDKEDDNELFELIGKMLEYEPTRRISMSAALEHPFFNRLPTHQRM